MTQPAPIGHNNPPTIEDELRERSTELLDRAQKLIDAADRIPAELDAESAGKATDFIKQVTTCAKAIEDKRKSEKEPFVEGGRKVDAFFKVHATDLDIAKSKASKPLLAYQTKVQEEERQRRLEQERIAREEADRKAEEARKLANAGLDEQANVELNKALRDEKKADRLASSVQTGVGLGVTKADSGATASTRKRTVVEIVDRHAINYNLLAAHFTVDAIQSALNSFVKAGGTEMPGVKIYEKTEVVVR